LQKLLTITFSKYSDRERLPLITKLRRVHSANDEADAAPFDTSGQAHLRKPG